jgi:hypothetical protein
MVQRLLDAKKTKGLQSEEWFQECLAKVCEHAGDEPFAKE